MFLKVFLLYVGGVLTIWPFLASMFAANETKEERKSKPKFPQKSYRIMFVSGIVIFCIGLSLFLF